MQADPIKILLVEDSPTDVYLFREALCDAGLDAPILIHVERLKEAISRLKSEQFDLVLLDLGLPDSTGLATYESLISDAPPIPAVVLTSLNDQSLALRALQLGAQDFLVKGEIDGRMLGRSIRYSIERNRLLLGEQNARLDAEKAEKDLTRALAEKNVLIQEVHHRVKNNLQVISSLLSLQARYSTDPQVSNIFRDSIARVRSMALVHELLYGSSDITKIDVAVYVQRLVETLLATYASTERGIKLNYSVDGCFLDVYTAAPLGLILNEIITNSLKHAFKSSHQTPEIFVQSTSIDPLVLVVGDNGAGIDFEIDWEHPPSFGLRLIRLLTQQIGGNLQCDTTGGTRFTITIPQTVDNGS